MSEPKPPSPNAEVLARQLKESLARRRPQPWKPVLVVLALSTMVLAGLAYWLYPRPRPAPLQVMALDVICTSEETASVRARLLRPADDPVERSLQGHTLVFSSARLALAKANDDPVEIIVKSDEHGTASAEWPMAKNAVADYLVHYVDRDKQINQRDPGRVFVWPRDARLLIVDADATFDGSTVDPQASASLLALAREKWHIVYLALATTQAHEFRKTRGWIGANRGKLPVGPVLGRPHFADTELPADTRRAALDWLKQRFPGSHVAIAKNASAAQIAKDAGLRAIHVGPAPATAWKHVPAALK
jgi:hypothetical protein